MAGHSKDAGRAVDGGQTKAAGQTKDAGYTKDKDDVLRRLRRIEGQVRGLARMVEDDTYCIDVLTQVAAANAALKSFALALLDDHLHCCVSEALVRGGDDAHAKVTEASQAIARFARS